MPRFRFVFAFVAVLISASALSSRAVPVVVELNAARDNTLFEDADGDTSSGSGIGLFAGRIRQAQLRRALIAFDLTGAIPEGAVVDSVRLVLHVVNTQDGSERSMSLHRVRADWGEGASVAVGGQGTTAEPGDATWLHTFYPSSFWTQPGGDFDPIPSGSTRVGGVGSWSWSSETMRDDVRGWISGSVANHGWMLLGDEVTNQTARRFDSRESAQVPDRPRLLIYYDTDTPVIGSSWGGIRSRYR